MRNGDWHDDRLGVVGMFVSGSPLRAPGPRGEQQHDSSFMIWLNARHDAVEVQHPANAWVHSGEVALSTDPDAADRAPGRVRAAACVLGGRSVVVLRQT